MTPGEQAVRKEAVWEEVLRRYAGGRAVAPLAGSSTLRIETVDDALIVSQRLWRAELTREDYEVAVGLLGTVPPGTGAVAFAEQLRHHYSGGPQVRSDCTRIPNICAVLLVDLGLLPT